MEVIKSKAKENTSASDAVRAANGYKDIAEALNIAVKYAIAAKEAIKSATEQVRKAKTVECEGKST